MKKKLEYLAAYLPYRLICLVDGKHKSELNAVYSNGTCTFCNLVESDKGFKSVKPVLKPLSAINWRQFINENRAILSEPILEFINYFNSDTSNYDAAILRAPYPVIQWCLKNHYDVFSLLDSGEAVTEVRVRFYPTDTDETFDGTVIQEKPNYYVVIPDQNLALTQNWNKNKCEVIS